MRDDYKPCLDFYGMDCYYCESEKCAGCDYATQCKWCVFKNNKWICPKLKVDRSEKKEVE